ncbi:hypothetical protein [Actinosynnema sp. NPDC020468]|uniref:hypothetical protein n=1 Tax=Actinosynnema sp. NPDC020468 TaxID=3154488 RepID=UPI0033D13DC1
MGAVVVPVLAIAAAIPAASDGESDHGAARFALPAAVAKAAGEDLSRLSITCPSGRSTDTGITFDLDPGDPVVVAFDPEDPGPALTADRPLWTAMREVGWWGPAEAGPRRLTGSRPGKITTARTSAARRRAGSC